LINLFRMRNGAALVDLPGYGFAQVPLAVRLQWQGLLEHYLTRRPNLVGLVLIMDSRRPLTELDWKMIGWFGPSGRPIHCLLTKSDKLTRQEQTKTLRETRTALADFGAQVTVQMFSSLKKIGMEEAEQVIGSWLNSDGSFIQVG
jgi:GTP-binding protein